MSDNYIVINGKRIELTEEQLKALNIEVRKNPFERVSINKLYYFIDACDGIGSMPEFGDRSDQKSIDCANYFNDKNFAEQVALHQQLYRKLLKFAYDNECEDTAEWDGINTHWSIIYDTYYNELISHWQKIFKAQEVCFSTKEAAEQAIEEVVKPFMKEHPEFVW